MSISYMDVSIAAFSPVSDHGGTTTAGTVALVKPSGAKEVLIQCTSGTARFTYGTVAPGTATGFQLRSGDSPVVIPLAVQGTVSIAPEAGTVSIAYQWGG